MVKPVGLLCGHPPSIISLNFFRRGSPEHNCFMFGRKSVYFDYAATTYTDPKVCRAMQPCLGRYFGNAGSLHGFGREAKRLIERARGQLAEALSCRSEEIVFTGSGTESDNLAVLGVARAYAEYGRHVVATTIEHKAVLNPIKKLAEEGFQTDLVPVNNDGLVDLVKLAEKIKDETILVSVIYANNEIGVIEPVSQIGRQIREIRADRLKRGVKTPIFFHTDACQAAAYLSLRVDGLGADLLTLNGSKIYGPKGMGALYLKSGTRILPIMRGGDQERGVRPGTENVPGIVGLGLALQMAQEQGELETKRQTDLRDYFIERLLKEIPDVVLNGHSQARMPNNINVSVLGIEGESMLLWLDKYGIAASTGSACDSKSLEPSHVILALGKSHEYAHGSLRLSLGRRTSKKEIDYFMDVFPDIVEKLRNISPA